jgi:hypothetical protein
MTPEQIVDRMCASFDGVVPKQSWGETSLFYNPDGWLPNGVYFCTLKEKDGDNDKASQLNREGVFRLAFGLAPNSYLQLFGDKPARPVKGSTVATGHNFAELDKLMPHPVYAWMCWGQILSPSLDSFERAFPLLEEAYIISTKKFQQKLKSAAGRSA